MRLCYKSLEMHRIMPKVNRDPRNPKASPKCFVAMYVSSGGSNSSIPLYRASLALHWLSDIHMALRWLPALNIALHWLPTTRFFITRAPNMLTRSEVELQPLHWLPTRAPNNSVLHYKGAKHANQTGSRIATPALAPYPGSLHRLSASGSTSRGSHKKDINKTQIEFKIVFFQHIIL